VPVAAESQGAAELDIGASLTGRRGNPLRHEPAFHPVDSVSIVEFGLKQTLPAQALRYQTIAKG